MTENGLRADALHLSLHRKRYGVEVRVHGVRRDGSYARLGTLCQSAALTASLVDALAAGCAAHAITLTTDRRHDPQ